MFSRGGRHLVRKIVQVQIRKVEMSVLEIQVDEEAQMQTGYPGRLVLPHPVHR